MKDMKTIPSKVYAQKTWLYLDLGLLDYGKAWRLQEQMVAARQSGAMVTDVFLLLEHPPVFTLGRKGGRENLTVPESFLEESGIPVFHVERGGNITFHGPGQLVGYGIVHLPSAGLLVVDYVTRLEEVMIRTAARWGIPAARNPLNRGVWVGSSKLGSVGIAVRRGVSFHGFAFNANVSLDPFGWIHPCGLKGVGVTSLAHELGRPVLLPEVRHALKQNIEDVFQVELAPVELNSGSLPASAGSSQGLSCGAPVIQRNRCGN